MHGARTRPEADVGRPVGGTRGEDGHARARVGVCDGTRLREAEYDHASPNSDDRAAHAAPGPAANLLDPCSSLSPARPAQPLQRARRAASAGRAGGRGRGVVENQGRTEAQPQVRIRIRDPRQSRFVRRPYPVRFLDIRSRRLSSSIRFVELHVYFSGCKSSRLIYCIPSLTGSQAAMSVVLT